MRMKETPADMQVKDLLWVSTEKEISRFVDRMAGVLAIEEESARRSARKDVCTAVKIKGYPVRLVIGIVSKRARIAKAEGSKKPNAEKIAKLKKAEADAMLAYRNRIGLMPGGRH